MTAISFTSYLKSVFENRKPIKILWDKGTEFVNSTVQKYLKYQWVNFQTTRNADIYSTITEWFNWTLKTIMYKYLTINTYRYLDIMNKF